MKIYILTDLEGISGLYCMPMKDPGDSQYEYSIKRLMSDVNAAIDGAFAGGATSVTVWDGHSRGKNFDLSLLDSRAETDYRDKKKKPVGNLDDSYSGAFIIGAHAMAGTLNAFLDHTQDSLRWYNYYLNGEKVGEMVQWAAQLAHFGIPPLMVSGDVSACDEAKRFFNPIECIAVKEGIERNFAKPLFSDEEAYLRIRETAKNAMGLIGRAKPYKVDYPATVKIEYTRSDYCDNAARGNNVMRIDARCVTMTINNGLEVIP